MPTEVAVDLINGEELQRAFAQAPELAFKFAKSEMGRFARRVRRRTIQEGLSGRPGLAGGQFKRGKHVQGFTVGTDLLNLKAVSKISRILRVHEEGGMIQGPGALAIRLQKGLPLDPRKVQGLFKIPGKPVLAIAEGKFIRALYLLRRQVVIPARLGFQTIWRRELPAGITKVGDAIHRAIRVSIEREMKAITRAVQRFAA